MGDELTVGLPELSKWGDELIGDIVSLTCARIYEYVSWKVQPVEYISHWSKWKQWKPQATLGHASDKGLWSFGLCKTTGGDAHLGNWKPKGRVIKPQAPKFSIKGGGVSTTYFSWLLCVSKKTTEGGGALSLKFFLLICLHLCHYALMDGAYPIK